MVDMTALLTVDTSGAKAPADPGDGVYSCMVTGWRTKDCPWDSNLGMVTFELKPLGWGENEDLGFDITKRRFFKDFVLNPAERNTYFYLDTFISRACGVSTAGRLLNETAPECIGREVSVQKSTRSYKKKDSGEEKTIVEYKMLIDGSVVNERRFD